MGRSGSSRRGPSPAFVGEQVKARLAPNVRKNNDRYKEENKHTPNRCSYSRNNVVLVVLIMCQLQTFSVVSIAKE